MFGYIYKITNLITGAVYIGQRGHSSFDERYWGSGKRIKSAIHKYGIENFNREIIDTAQTQEELNEKEIFWIAFARSYYDICYNIANGGEGNSKPCYEETKEKLRQINLGKKASEQKREKCRQNSLRMWQNPERKNYNKAWNKGKTNIYSEDTLKSNSNKHKELWNDPEYRKRVMEGHARVQQRTRAEKIKAINTNTGEELIFNSKTECMNYFDCKCINLNNDKTTTKGKVAGWLFYTIKD